MTLRVVECKGCLLCRSLSVTVLGGDTARRRVPSGGRRAKEAAGPLRTGRYASGTPSARLADGTDFALISAAA